MRRALLLAALLVALPLATSAHHVPVPDGRLNAAELVHEYGEQKAAIILALSVYGSAATGGESVTLVNDVEAAFTAGIDHLASLTVRDCLLPVRAATVEELERAAEWFRTTIREPASTPAAVAALNEATTAAAALTHPAVTRLLCTGGQ